jgi:hypothetical protein
MDIALHAGTKFALEQWLDARGLGDNVQDTDPASPTFGQYFYTHTAPGTFIYWRHPSGKLEKTNDVSDPENPVITYYNGFYAILRFPDVETMEALLAPWVRNNTATSILEGFNGVGGEGITLIAPEEINAKMAEIGLPGHEILGGMSWSDPRVWYLSPVMTGDEVEFEGTAYRSLIDFNVWSPTQYPGGWEEVAPSEPEIEPWVQPTGAQDAYNIGDQVLFNGQVYESLINANVWSPTAYPAGWRLL